MEYEKLSKNALGCMYMATIIGDGIAIAIMTALLKLWIVPKNITVAAYIIYAVIGILLCSMAVAPFIRFQRYRYRITEECIEVKEGFLTVTHTMVPMERLQKIETQRGPIDRIFGVTKVNVTTAGGDVTIRFLKEEQAQEIATGLTREVNKIVNMQKEAVKESGEL